MNKILVICGATATGKTSLALALSKKFNCEIISADSRQVYKGLDIGTGKDIPKDFQLRGSGITVDSIELNYYTNGFTRIWGYDLVEPNFNFNISQFQHIVNILIPNILKRKKIPVIVGGSGLYIKAITTDIDTVNIPRNEKLRYSLERKTVSELYEILARNDPVKAGSLNFSDMKNKRRLIRAIEINFWKNGSEKSVNNVKSKNAIADYLFVGLSVDKEKSKKMIEKRVLERIKNGFQEEVERLIISGISWEDQSMQSLGYRQIKEYFYGNISKKEFIDKWILSEIKYIKRQNTWFKKDKRMKKGG